MPLAVIGALMVCLLVAPGSAGASNAAGCERATAYCASVKVARFGSRTYVTYLDVDFRARVMALDHRSGQWEGPVVVGQGVDNHGGGALSVTPDGIIHLAYGAHGTPMHYSHTLRPEDIRDWSEPLDVGVRTTYPSLVADPEGALHLAYRGHDNPDSGDWLQWQLAFHTRAPEGDWSRGIALSDLPSETEKPRASYHHRLVRDVRGRLHLAWASILVAPGRIYYLCSADGGRTWAGRPDGPALALPGTSNTLTPVYTSSDPNLMLAIAPDASGTPHLLYGPEYGSSLVEHVVPDGKGGWRKLGSFRMKDRTVWLHQASLDREGRLHVTFFAETPGRWLSNSAVAYQALWQPGKEWVCRPIADLTKYNRGCFMPAICEANQELECVFYSGRDLDIATNTKSVWGHVGTDVYYANLTRNWYQRIAPKPGMKRKITTEWTPLPDE